MARILDDETLRKDLIARGRERVKHFSWERSVKAIHESYMNVLGVPVPARPAPNVQ
jgi:hypothetical protein